MGGMITVDPWLLDLADRGANSARVARTLAYAQHDITKQTGHLIALNDAFVKRKVQDAAAAGKLASVGVRCIRCGNAATLADWVGSSKKTEAERFRFWEAIRQSHGTLAAAFLQSCPGDASAAQTLGLLEDAVNGDAP